MVDRFDNLIGGEWHPGTTYLPNINPSNTADVIGDYAQASADQVTLAIDAAEIAFPGWSTTGIQTRADILEKAASEILTRREELGALLAREEGKVLVEAIGEVTRAGQIFRFFAGEALRNSGEHTESVRPGITIDTVRESLGPIGIITPWNFPIAIPAWKIAPALAFGNCVVFKPAELVPGCAWALTEILKRAGLPDGVINLVSGPGPSVGASIINDPRIRAVSFTGSQPVGKQVSDACSLRNAKVQTEMGGKNPLLVLKDADFNVAVECAINGAYFSTGQRCTASSRLLVDRSILEPFIEALKNRLSTLVIGDALDEATDIGPVVSESQLHQNLEYVAIGKAEGAELLFGGETLTRSTNGFFMTPALFVGTKNEMRINQEEIFGPVASVIAVDGYEEGVNVANDTSLGLCAGICTQSLKFARQFQRESKAGMAMVNLPTAGVDYHVPFGGNRGSSYGPREQGRYAREFYTSVKTTYVASP